MSGLIKIGDRDWTLDPGPFRVTNVQFSGSMPGGHGSASFEVPVENAYLAPHHVLREGEWISIYDDAHELYEGEIFSIKPSVDASGQHKLSVVCGGLISVAGKRADVSATWVHRGPEGWIRRPGTPSNLGNLNLDGKVELRVLVGSTESFDTSTLSSCLATAFYLDSGLSDDTISFCDFAGPYDVTVEGAYSWTLAFYTNTSLYDPGWTATALTTSNNANASWASTLTPPVGTKAILVLLYCSGGAHTVAADKSVTLNTCDIYSRGRTTKPRIDEAMVDIATRPGFAVSYKSQPIGPEQDDLRIGSGLAKITTATGLTTLAALHSEPFEYAFWDQRHFDIAQMPRVPINDAKVIVVGGGNPGLDSWEIAEYDEDEPSVIAVLFGNKDDATLPEGYPRILYRPSTPSTNMDVKVDLADFSQYILSDAAAATIGGGLLPVAGVDMPGGQVFDAHPGYASTGVAPGNNSDPTNVYQDHYSTLVSGTLHNFGGTTVTGGTITTSAPYTYHTFTTDGLSSLVISAGASLNVEYLLVGGGGAGGAGTSYPTMCGGLGGGGGEVLTGTAVLGGTVSVVVGAGGVVAGGYYAGGNGGSSIIGSIVANGGHGGIDGIGIEGRGWFTGSGTSGSGYVCGGNNYSYHTATAGGGDTAVGGNAGSSGGIGGAGEASSFSGSSVDYGGGGGGGAPSYSAGGSGVYGGGNGGGSAGAATAGTANRGGGGGGGRFGSSMTAGAGGSGIVIVRYLTADLAGGYNSNSGWAGSNSALDPSCLSAAGVDDYVDFGDVSACDFGTGAFSVRAWVRVTSAPTYAAVVSKYASGQGWKLGVDSSRQVYGVAYGSVANYRERWSDTALVVGQWYHVVMTYAGSGGEVAVFINGLDDTSAAAGAVGAWNTSNAGSLRFFSDTSYYFDGALGRVTVWGRQLSADEVLSDLTATSEFTGRSLAKGTVVISGSVRNRKGAPVPAHHVRAGWWIQNTDWQPDPAKPPPTLYITGHSVDLAGKKNALTIGVDWMEEEIGVRKAELLAIPDTPDWNPAINPPEPTTSDTPDDTPATVDPRLDSGGKYGYGSAWNATQQDYLHFRDTHPDDTPNPYEFYEGEDGKLYHTFF